MFDIRRRNAPRNIRDLFEDISNIHSYNTRSSASNNFYTQSSRLSIQLNSFSRIGTIIWNEMPLTLRNLSKNDFKRKIKRKLFDTSHGNKNNRNIALVFYNRMCGEFSLRERQNIHEFS